MTEPTVVLRPEIMAQPVYKQGKPAAPGSAKLSSNELPFEPIPEVAAAVAAANEYNRYPDGGATRLTAAIAERYGVTADRVLVGNGSVSLLYQLALAAAGPGDEIVYPWPSFEAYPGIVAVTGATGRRMDLLPDGRHDLDAMADAINERTRLVFICSPNNPTGPSVTQDELTTFLDSVRDDLLVVLDEAYIEFATDADTADGSKLIDRYPNVVVARTFSKAYGLAALRIGYLIGDAQLLAWSRAAAIPLSVTAQAQAGALAALETSAETARRVAEVAVRRDEIVRALRDQGWDIPDTQSNFFWLPTRERTAEADEILRENGVVARPFPGSGIRVSIGDDASIAPTLAGAAAVIDRFPYLRRADDEPTK